MTPPAIAEGASGPAVRWAQYLLVRRTLSYTQIDGIFGPVTKTAVEQFQRDRHLAADGIVGPATWAALGGDRAQPPTLAQGSHGPVAGRLQTALNQGRGSFAPGSDPVLAVDGIYGALTAAAVRGAQQLGGIAADGVVGLQTWALPARPGARRAVRRARPGSCGGDPCGYRRGGVRACGPVGAVPSGPPDPELHADRRDLRPGDQDGRRAIPAGPSPGRRRHRRAGYLGCARRRPRAAADAGPRITWPGGREAADRAEPGTGFLRAGV